MASNESKVLDPAVPVDMQSKNAAGRALNRRNLMAGLGMAGAAAVGAGLLSRRTARRPSVVQAVASVPTGFSEVDYLNFLLNIKYLQASFYSFITQGTDLPYPYTVNGNNYYPILGAGAVYEPLAKVVFTTLPANGQQVTDLLNEIYYDEVNQLVNLQNLINGQIPGAITGSGAVIRPNMDLLGKNSTSTTATTITAPKALAQARLLEDLSVTASAGVAAYLTGANLSAVSQILAVDGLHAGALRLAIIQQNAATPGTVVDLVSDSAIVPAAAGAFWQVQADDVAPFDTGVANVGLGPQVAPAANIVQFAATENVVNPCTAPIIPFPEVYTITSVAATAAVVTVQAVNNFSSGQTGVVIAGLTGVLAGYNGTFTLTSVTSTQFTYALVSAGIASTATTTGTASSSASAYTTCTPTQYQGFFATAGAGTASGSTPAGFAFARTTSQVLSVLYASAPGATPASPPLPSPNTNPLGANSLEYQGGFFPSGVNGPINAIIS